MKRDFLPFFVFLVLFCCAAAIIFFASPKIQAAFHRVPNEPVKDSPAFFKEFKELLPDFGDFQ